MNTQDQILKINQGEINKNIAKLLKIVQPNKK